MTRSSNASGGHPEAFTDFRTGTDAGNVGTAVTLQQRENHYATVYHSPPQSLN
jgi:hypothetical protein